MKKRVISLLLMLAMVLTMLPQFPVVTTASKIPEYSKVVLDINWDLINAVGKQASNSKSCSCYALAYCTTLLDKKVHHFSEYNRYGNTEYSVLCEWSWGDYISWGAPTLAQAYNKIYNDIVKGYPVVVQVPGSVSTHYVTIVGFENITDFDSISPNNFLILDPGSSVKAIQNMGKSGYYLRASENSKSYQVVYNAITSKAVDRAVVEYTSNSRQHTLTFDGNGGSAIDSITAAPGETVTIPSTIPTLGGMNFCGWSTSSSGNAVYQPGDTLTLTGDTTLYASWSGWAIDYTYPAQYSYNIVYPGTGAYFELTVPTSAMYEFRGRSDGAMDTTFKLYNNINKLLASDDDSGGNLQFRLQHYLEADKTYWCYIAPYDSSAVGTMTWDIRQGYDVWYMDSFGNIGINSGFTGGDCFPSLYVDTEYDTTIISDIPEKSGYIFAGWSTLPNATTAMYQPGEEATLEFEPGLTPAEGKVARLYPVWSNVGGVTGISVVANKTEYLLGEDFDWESLTVTWHYSDGTTYTGAAWDLNGSVSIDGFDNQTEGTKTIVFYYDDFRSTFEIKVIPSGHCGDDLYWKLSDDGTLTIFGTGAMYDYLIGGPWYAYNDNITKVIVSEGVTSIGETAFFDCENATSVIIPSSLKSVGESAFLCCDSLTSVMIPEGATSIGNGAFSMCYNLDTVMIPLSVTDIEISAFDDCAKLTYVYYAGTAEQWNNIKIESNNTSLTDANVNYKTIVVPRSEYPESAHNYAPNTNETQTFSWPGAEELTFRFSSSTEVETNNYDNINVYNGAGFLCTEFTGKEAANVRMSVLGDTFSIQLISDGSVQKYGYSLDYIVAHMPSAVTGITVKTLPSKTQYFIGQSFDTAGLTVTATYSDGSSQMVTSGYTVTGFDSATPGTQTLTVTYEGFTTTFDVTVIPGGTCGDNLTWMLDDEGTLTISGTGSMNDYSGYEVYAPWDDYRSYIKSVLIEDGVTSIGSCAFDVYDITSVTIPDSVTHIGDLAFYYCYLLNSVTIPDGVTHIGERAFGKTGITSVIIPDSVTEIGYGVFMECGALTSVIIPDSITYIVSSTFEFCESLESVIIPDSVTSIEDYAFLACSSLTSVTIPVSVTAISDYAFDGCNSLTDVYYGGSATQWAAIDINTECNEDLINATIHYAARELSGITVRTQPDKTAYWTGEPLNITGLTLTATYDDGSTKTITSGFTVTGFDSATAGTKAVTVTYEDFITTFDVTVLLGGTCGENLTWTLDDEGTLTISGTGTMTSYISKKTPWDSQKSKIKNIVIDSGVTTIGGYAFQYCSNVASVTLPEGIVEIGMGAFFDCDSLKSVAIPNVEIIYDYTFAYCRSLKSITIPDSVTTIGARAFYECRSATKIVIGNGTTSIGDRAFYNCWSATQITMGTSVTSIGDYSFYYCANLRSITLSDSTTTIGKYAFYDCDALTSITIPDSITYIGLAAFTMCDKLTDVYYGGSASEWAQISNDCGIEKLTNATIHYARRELTGIAISQEPAKINYQPGELLDTTGLELTLIYDDGSTATINEGYSISGFDSTTEGSKAVMVTYEGFTATFDVLVKCPHSGGEATCKDQAVCSVCGASYGKLNTENHKGTTYLVGQKDATYDEEGYTGDTYCSDCNELVTTGTSIPVIERPVQFEIVSQPASVEITAGFMSEFTVEATDAAAYMWQYRRNENAPWVNTTLSGNRTATLSVPAILSRNGYQYRCRVTGNNGKLLYTEPATLTVNDSILINTQPTRQIVNVDANATFTVAATGEGLTYQWQYRKNDEDFWKVTGLTGNKTPTLTVPALLSRNGYQYLCAITDENGIKIQSKVAVLSTIGFTAQPADQTVELDTNAVFSVAAKGQDLTYKWQYRKSPNGSWLATSLPGYDTDTLTVLAITSRNGYQYRCGITDALGTLVYSDVATLTVSSGIEITAQPTNQTASVGLDAVFTVAATGQGLTYQWQYRQDASGSWLNTSLTGANTDTLTVPAETSRNGYQYRCVVTDQNGVSVSSNAATLTVKTGIKITSQPSGQTAPVGMDAVFTVKASGDGLTYQWQYRKTSTGSWLNTGLPGATTNTLTVQALKDRHSYQYRCVITDANGVSVYTNAATLTVFNIVTQPADKTVAVDANAVFTVTVTGTGLTYQWQYRKSESDPWLNTSLTGYKTAKLTVQALASRDGYQYRCVITDSKGNKLTTDAATLKIK